VQRLLKALRKQAAEKLIAHELLGPATHVAPLAGSVDGSGYIGPDPPTAPPWSAPRALWGETARSTLDRQHRWSFQGNIRR
jgi:hypothetical protein